MRTFWDICIKETYQSQGKDVTKWHQVGKLMLDDQGRYFLNMPLLPKLYVFEQKEKNEAHKAAAQASRPQDDDAPPY